MGVATAQSEIRLARLVDERELVQRKHESLLAAVEAREDKALSPTEDENIKLYREKSGELDSEIDELSQEVSRAAAALEQSKKLRRAMAGNEAGVDIVGDELVYSDFKTYARDYIITRTSPECSKIAMLAGGEDMVLAAKERLQLLKRTPANTLSSNVAGLNPPQYIAQIFQVIDKSRPIVASAYRTTLERGVLTFPKITQRPVVAVQAAEKTEAGNQGMIVAMEQSTASTYLGGGDLSWQAINWSTPDALQLWFDLAAADYALKTESDAGQVIESAAANHVISDVLAGTSSDTYADWLVALTEGAAAVYANSGRLADTVYVAPSMFYLAAALTSAAFAQLTSAGRLNLGTQGGDISGMNVIVSRGLHSGVAVVGDSQALIVAETAGAPVELRVVEPAIGGVEVGVIGAFEAVVAEDTAFALISTAS